MEAPELFDIFIFLVFVSSVTLLILHVSKYPKIQVFFNSSKIEREKEYVMTIDNITPKETYQMCIDWLSMFESEIIERNEPSFIKASHKIDVLTHSLTYASWKIKDIPKILEFHIREYVGTDTELAMKITINTAQRDIGRFDFTDLEWYKREIFNIFKEKNVHMKM
ncbi:hypothetical protein JXL21_12735 [Candidatus Bathyarchaeota archaeon]|nr:hypothetical protein [Candidatus Bathyarchaeota archaeon]